MLSQNFLKVAEVSSIPDGGMKTVEAGGQQILIVNVGGKYYAIGAICKHEEWDLSEGSVDEGRKVTCAGHGAVWNLETGMAEFDEPLENEPLYDLKVEGQDILVNPQPRAQKR